MDIFTKVDIFLGYVTELTYWIEEEEKEFPYTERLRECGEGICGALREAKSAPGHSQKGDAEASRQADEFCRLMGLLVETGVLTEIQSKPLLSECMAIREEAAMLRDQEARLPLPRQLNAGTRW